MLLRLILALVLAIAALPMPAAACDHAMPMAASSHNMDGKDHDAPMPMEHVCVGCIAVADWGGARVAPPVPVAAPPLTMRVATMPLLPGQAPTPPPPRKA